MASIYCWKLVKLLDIEKTEKNKGKEIGTKSPVVHVEVQSLLVDITLPGHVHLRVGIQPIFIDTGEGLLVRAQTQLATVDVLTDEEQLIYERLTQVTELTVECRKPPGTSATKVEAEVMSAEVRVPYGFKMAKVIENAISMQKAIKRLCAAELGLRLKTPSTTGHSIPIYDTIPIIRVQISTLCIRFADDPFESALSRNYLLGFEEQEGRIARDKAFQTKAAALRSVDERRRGSVHDEHKQSTAVENAWGLLQEFNARAWIDRLRKAHKETEGPPPLMHTTITNIQVAIDPPVLLANSIEQTLHIIDPATPANALYDEQIPRNVTISMHSLKMQIRDYSAPLVCLPADGSVKLETKGLVIFAEQVSAAEANRTVVIPVGLPTGEEVVVARTVNPNKMYSSLTTTITTSSTIHAAWGASLEPGISDMISVFDTFTKPNVDPSQPLGWWDKLRLIMHGTHTLIITGGGDISFRVLGSTSPYFDGHKHFGTEGMQVSMRDGVRIEVNGSQIPGEDVTIECGELGFALPFNARAGHHHRAKEEDTVARMRGGVRLVFGFGFVTERNRRDPASGLVKSHADICLRAPEYIDSDQLRKWDSFRGFRSSSINITVRLESPKPFYAGLSEPSNSVHLTLNTMSRFFTFLQVYQSVLTSLPVRKGKLFQEDGPGPSKQKLGRTIGSIRIQTSLHPLLLGFVAEAQDKSLGVGLRCRAAQVVMDMTLLQRVIQQRRPKEELLKRKPTSKWILRDSELELTDVEARALAFGDFSEARPATLEKPLSVDELDQPGASDDKDWIFPRDALRKKRPTLNLVPFAWTPKIIYTKSNDTKVSGAQDSTRSKKDIFEVQKHLFKSRLREIEAAIRHYLEMQRGLEYRMAVFFDDSLRQQSQIIVEKMAILHEKKVVIERYIRSCQQKLECDNVGDKAAGRAERKLPAAAVFQHHFVVHNLNLIWKKDVRNILFQMVSLQQKAMAIKFCLSHTATKLMAQLVTSFAERRNRTDAPETAHDVLADTAKTAPAPKSSMVFAELDANAAHRLLNKLVDEMDTAFFVSNETEVEQDDDAAESNNRGAALAFNNRKVYFPSRDIESPDYISDSQTYESNFMMQLVYPQVNLEAESKDNPSHLESVVLAAESMQLRSIRILDAQASTSSTADENSDRNEEIVKSRMVVNIYDAQLFVARKTDIEVAPEFDLDNIAMHQPWDKSDTPTAAAWPIWVPIECIADHSSHPGFLERVVERVSASLHRDVPNPLYLKGDVASTQPETKHTLQINIPTFFITATAMQYMVIYDVIENLLVYRDPGRGEQVEKMTKMLLILEQMEDLRKVQETVLLLQQKIRQTEAMLHTDMDNSGLTVGASSHRNAEILRHLLQCQDELIIVVDAIKATQSLEQKKKSAAISSEILIKMGKMVWCMLTDEQTPLCEWTLDKAQFGGVHHEDQTDVNTLHIDKLHLENHMSAMNSFKEVIAPYSPDMTDVDFTRHKMIRVYWRQMAPVAGIKVVDHFEVNIYPLLIQVTYDMAKEIVFYLFPEKKAKAAAKTHAQQLHNTISSTSADNVAVVDDKLRPSSPSEPDMSPQTERKRRFKSGTFSYSHGRTLSSKSETKEEASSSPKLRRKETRVNELKQMQARASENRSFIYIKMPGANHCLSYRGSKEKNIEDLYMFAFKMPTLEFRNKTWTWLDFLDAVKKEALRAVLANTGALVREKLFVKRKPSTASDEHGNATLQAPPARHNKFPGRGIFGSRKDGSDKEKDTTKEKQKEKEKEKEVGKEKSQSGLPSKDKPTKEIKKTRMPPSTELLFEVNEED
ncbi:golgi-body localization protein domain-containing protein [Fimicolochytrium jonesii]|uniref:golgi-body localization protein domain-containing protein n=1 Tax=Fimicolochytrium jonesii TaxID=1396493 RepID=UPI0022FDC29B|nr:golgi-body localization protein domain-containing protein [Fimicolochytrium jonesii]KAI8818444.1 golgi-body localization protein domain-containing protein [Fimicolochytrium jonesii]